MTEIETYFPPNLETQIKERLSVEHIGNAIKTAEKLGFFRNKAEVSEYSDRRIAYWLGHAVNSGDRPVVMVMNVDGMDENQWFCGVVQGDDDPIDTASSPVPSAHHAVISVGGLLGNEATLPSRIIYARD